jgi:hypothetical protein
MGVEFDPPGTLLFNPGLKHVLVTAFDQAGAHGPIGCAQA